MLIDRVCDLLTSVAASRSVSDVRIGLGYIGVQLDDGNCGVAYCFRDSAGEGCSVIREAGTLTNRPASDLGEWARRSDPIASATGLAALNALIPAHGGTTEADLLDELQVSPEDIIGMVGYFGPFVKPLRSRAKALHVLERHPVSDPHVLPDVDPAAILPRCNIVIISATTLLNRTLDDLLSHCGNAREVALLGPSTPMLPKAFAGWPVTLLSGIRVVSPERLLRVISEGGGTRQFGPAVRKVTLRLAI